MRVANVNDLLHLVIATHEDAGPIVDMFRHSLEHPTHLAGNGLTTSWNESVQFWPISRLLEAAVG